MGLSEIHEALDVVTSVTSNKRIDNGRFIVIESLLLTDGFYCLAPYLY